MRPEGFWADPLGCRVEGIGPSNVARTDWLRDFRITDRDRALARHLARAGPATAMQAAAWLGRSERVDDRSRERQRVNKLIYCGWLRKMRWETASGGGTPLLVGPGALAERDGVRVWWEWTPRVVSRSVVLHQLLLRMRSIPCRWRRQSPYGAPTAARLRVNGHQVVVSVPRRGDWAEGRLAADLARHREADGIWVIVPASADLARAVAVSREGELLSHVALCTDVDLWRLGTPISDVWLVWSGETLAPARLRALVPAPSLKAQCAVP